MYLLVWWQVQMESWVMDMKKLRKLQAVGVKTWSIQEALVT